MGAGVALDAGDAVFAIVLRAVLVTALEAGEAVAVAVGVDVSVAVAVGVSVGVGVGVGVARTQSIGWCTQMRVALWPARAAVMSPVWTNLLLAGS